MGPTRCADCFAALAMTILYRKSSRDSSSFAALIALMNKFLNSSIGRLRLIGLLEGASLLILLFLAMPVKYLLGNPAPVRIVGMTHGLLFILFVFYTIGIASTRQWSFTRITWKLLLASVVPFGTFYVDRKVLRPMDQK